MCASWWRKQSSDSGESKSRFSLGRFIPHNGRQAIVSASRNCLHDIHLPFN
jgi:hypothetical protein